MKIESNVRQIMGFVIFKNFGSILTAVLACGTVFFHSTLATFFIVKWNQRLANQFAHTIMVVNGSSSSKDEVYNA